MDCADEAGWRDMFAPNFPVDWEAANLLRVTDLLRGNWRNGFWPYTPYSKQV